MKIELKPNLEHFDTQAVKSGRYQSPDAIVAAALDLLATHEAKLHDLRTLLDEALAEGGEHDDADIGAALDDAVRHLTARAG
jgi:putative addiction module CopG family antidote